MQMFVGKMLVKLAFYLILVLFLLEAERGSAGLYQQHLGVPGRQIQSSRHPCLQSGLKGSGDYIRY